MTTKNVIVGWIQSAASICLTIYILLGFFIGFPYFNWQYASEHGFASWFFFGEIVATCKAAIWPYYLVHASDSLTPLLLLLGVGAVLAVGSRLLEFLARWVAAKGSVARNVTGFFLALPASYAAVFVLYLWMVVFTEGVPAWNVVPATITWGSITLIGIFAALKTSASAYTISVPFIVFALLTGLTAFAHDVPRAGYLTNSAVLSTISILIVSSQKAPRIKPEGAAHGAAS